MGTVGDHCKDGEEVDNFWIALALTALAGLSTGIGSMLAFFSKKSNAKFLAISLGFSAGVMIYVSMIEIFHKAQNALINELGQVKGSWVTVIAFFGGMLLIAVIDRLIPSSENPHELHSVEEICADCPEGSHHIEQVQKRAEAEKNRKLLRMGLFTALAITIHVSRKGYFVAAQNSAGDSHCHCHCLHNIPEEIAVSVDILSGSKKAFSIPSLGFCKPVGASGLSVLLPFMNAVLTG